MAPHPNHNCACWRWLRQHGQAAFIADRRTSGTAKESLCLFHLEIHEKHGSCSRPKPGTISFNFPCPWCEHPEWNTPLIEEQEYFDDLL